MKIINWNRYPIDLFGWCLINFYMCHSRVMIVWILSISAFSSIQNENKKVSLAPENTKNEKKSMYHNSVIFYHEKLDLYICFWKYNL